MAYKAPVVRTSGASFANLQAYGLPGLIDLVTAANTALANPTTQATISATGGGASGGALAAGTYYLTYTFSNGIGETTAGTSRSAQLTVSAGNIPRVTLPSLPTGASGMKVYLTAADGASGTEVLYYAGATSTTLDLTSAGYDDSSVSAPTTNTTAATTIQVLTDAIKRGNVDKVYRGLDAIMNGFLHGDPGTYDTVRKALLERRAAVQVLVQALDDIMTLVDANRGTLTTSAGFNGIPQTRRTFS